VIRTERAIGVAGFLPAMSDPAVEIEFDDDGLVPVVAQDADSGAVLMLAYADREAVAATRESGLAHYHSRSRDELWKKGGSSGHVQEVREIRVDCDADTLLYLVSQEGGACHTGYDTCFHRTIDGEVVGERVFDPDSVYE
jgi:phosphoribosyl-AMP cyclohydrolase